MQGLSSDPNPKSFSFFLRALFSSAPAKASVEASSLPSTTHSGTRPLRVFRV